MAKCNGHAKDGKLSNETWLSGDEATRRLATNRLAMLQQRLWSVEDRLARLEAGPHRKDMADRVH